MPVCLPAFVSSHLSLPSCLPSYLGIFLLAYLSICLLLCLPSPTNLPYCLALHVRTYLPYNLPKLLLPLLVTGNECLTNYLFTYSAIYLQL